MTNAKVSSSRWRRSLKWLAAMFTVLLVMSNTHSASAEEQFPEQTFTSSWDQLPDFKDVVRTSGGDTVMLATVRTGDSKTGISTKLILATTDSVGTELDRTLVVVDNLFEVSQAAIAELKDGRLVVAYSASRFVRHKKISAIQVVYSNDSGSSWSAPANAPVAAADTDVLTKNGLRIREESSGAVVIFSFGWTFTISAFWYSTDPSLATWTAGASAGSPDDEYGGESFGQLDGMIWGMPINTYFVGDSLHVPQGYGSQIYDQTFSGYGSGTVVEGAELILAVKGSKQGAFASNQAGDLAAGVFAITKAKKLTFTYRVLSAATQKWSVAKTISIGSSSTFTTRGSNLWLANGGGIAFTYSKKLSRSKYLLTMRTVGADSVVSSPIDASSVVSPDLSSGLIKSTYFGGTDFVFLRLVDSEELPTVAVDRGSVGNFTSSSFDYPPSGGRISKGLTQYFLEKSVGAGINAGTDAPNYIWLRPVSLTQ